MTLIFHQNVPNGLLDKTVYQNFEICSESRLRANLVLIFWKKELRVNEAERKIVQFSS